ncbi:long-chain fatty acid--CoA ligase [Actinocatenispora rupis]|nr:long-chain fatty acid--CoA ligase [Actinocatenispora rupis]
MRSTMQDGPLRLARILEHGSTVHGATEVVTWTADGPRTTTYAQVGRDAARLAHALRELGVTGDQRVGTFCWNNAEHLVAYMAVPAMGAVLHPLNIRLPAEQLVYVANQAEDRVVLVDGTLIPALARVLPRLTTVEHVIVVGAGDTTPLADSGKTLHSYEELLAGRPETFDWPDGDEHDAAAICYSSGTVGNPKGVAYSHRSIWLHSMQVGMAESFGFSPLTRSLVVVPMFHVMAWGIPHAAFMSGVTLIMPDRFLQPEPLAAMIAAAKPTHAAAVPSIWTGLLAHLNAYPTDTSSLSEVIVGGSACPEALMRGFDEHGIRIVHAWGMTETSPLGSVARPPVGVTGADEWRYRLTQGRVPASVQARIVGPDGRVAPNDGEAVGELEVRGPWITGRYLDSDEPDPDRFDDGWLRTGDVGTLTADGYLTLTDRAKDVIKSGGEWISSVELENHLMAHPAVLEAAVVGVPDPRWEERPLASVVLREGATATPAELQAFLAERIPRWQLPERWTFITEVPKTTVGKFDKKVLRARYAAGELTVDNLRETT